MESSPLHWAASTDAAKTAQLLLDFGVDMEEKGQLRLHGHIEGCRSWLPSGAGSSTIQRRQSRGSG